MERLSAADGPRPAAWKWQVCGLLFLATVVLYLDRQTLALTISRISDELHLTNQQYGRIEKGFGQAFAVGAIVLGVTADRVNVRWLYPLVLLAWSAAGVATAWGVEIGRWLTELYPSLLVEPPGSEPSPPGARQAFVGFMVCRVLLGFFEAGHWPCALITVQRMLEPRDRPFGNGLLQSGASIGAVLAPLAALALLTNHEGSWRRLFVLVGLAGMAWAPAWLWLVRGRDLRKAKAAAALPPSAVRQSGADLARRVVTLLVVVITINMTWQFLRAWQPKMLREEYGRSEWFVLWFNCAFYLVADVGCLLSGFLVKRATRRGTGLDASRIAIFTACALLAALTTAAASLPHDRLELFLFVLLLVGAGSLGLFPIYYSLTQDVSAARMGLVTGVLSFCTWMVTAEMQERVGRSIDETKSYATGLFWSGLLPMAGVAALLVLWPRAQREAPAFGAAGRQDV